MTVIPAIDIIGGNAVRLTKGDYSRVSEYNFDPVDLVKLFVDSGLFRIHVVDLDGAKSSEPFNLNLLEKMARVDGSLIEWSGGIKNSQNLKSVINAGASFISAGSVAVKKPEEFNSWLKEYGADRIILAADVMNGQIALQGWTEYSSSSINNLLDEFIPSGLNQAIITDIKNDGTLKGVEFNFYRDLMKAYPEIIFTVSGGVSSVKDLEEAISIGIERIIVGKAFYEHHISVKEMSDFNKG